MNTLLIMTIINQTTCCSFNLYCLWYIYAFISDGKVNKRFLKLANSCIADAFCFKKATWILQLCYIKARLYCRWTILQLDWISAELYCSWTILYLDHIIDGLCCSWTILHLVYIEAALSAAGLYCSWFVL